MKASRLVHLDHPSCRASANALQSQANRPLRVTPVHTLLALAALLVGVGACNKPSGGAESNGAEQLAAGAEAANDENGLPNKDKNAAAKALLEFGENNPMLKVGDVAPEFELPDIDGKKVSLASLKGKTVVLEWINPECPFVEFAHQEGPLKQLAREQMAANPNLVWVAINSAASGRQGFGVELNKSRMEKWQTQHTLLLDEKGEVGKRYGARATPQVFVIDTQGKVAYQGALDNAPLGKIRGEGKPINYLSAALADLASGRPVATPDTVPYGCSVKYGS
jgi:alkyl hydroperoxide reductase subunit AhpC